TWADEELNISHDAGVRLNAALSFQRFDPDKKTFQNADSKFGVRANLPPTATIKYDIQCGQAQPIALEEPWRIVSLVEEKFTDVKSFVQNVCATKPEPAGTEGGANVLRNQIKDGLIHMKEEPAHYKKYLAYKERLIAEAEAKTLKDAAPAPPPSPAPGPPQQFAGADLLSTGNGTAFYHLKSQPDVGVLVFHTFDADPDYEVPNLIKGLKAFHARGVTKLVIDFQGNPGGYVNLAANTVNTFFPSNEFLATNLASDLRVTPVIQQLAAASFGLTGGIYDAAQYIDFGNKNQAYTNDSLFLQPVTYTRGGRTSQYTQRTTATSALAPTDPSLATFAWTNNAANIRILTDGRCGSSCAIVAHHLTNVHKVQAYAIGGNSGSSLSMYSFAGGTVSDDKKINGYFAAANLSSPLKPLPYASTIGLPILEIYAHGSAIPLEYDAAVYSSDYRMAYTTTNSQDRLVMWGEVSSHAWST
ncbi:hypothetical protein BGX30_006512, partial [Mortierella sp. GBA39]